MKSHLLVFILIFLPYLLPAQSTINKGKGYKEIGLDLFPSIAQRLNKRRPSWSAFELFFKSNMKRGAFRVKLGYNARAIHEEFEINFIPISDYCVDKISFTNRYAPGRNYSMSLGYEYRRDYKKYAIYYGGDLNMSIYKGETLTYKEFCISYDTNARGTVLHRVNLAGYNSVGLLPFIGLKTPIFKGLVISLEIGIRGDYIFGNRIYLDKREQKKHFKFNDFDINFGGVSSDISISYLFN